MPAMKAVSGTLRLDLAQYRELQAFAQFGSDLDEATQNTLKRGARLVELLKQDQYQPLPVGQQVASIYAGINGFLDKLEVSEVKAYEAALIAHIQTHNADLLSKAAEGVKLKVFEADLKKAIEDFDKGYKVNG